MYWDISNGVTFKVHGCQAKENNNCCNNSITKQHKSQTGMLQFPFHHIQRLYCVMRIDNS